MIRNNPLCDTGLVYLAIYIRQTQTKCITLYNKIRRISHSQLTSKGLSMGQFLAVMIVFIVIMSIVRTAQFGGRVINKVDKWSKD